MSSRRAVPCARAADRERLARAYEAAPGAAVQNVHADEPETSNVTFPMTVMGFVHLDDRGTTRCKLRAIPPPYTPPLTSAGRGDVRFLGLEPVRPDAGLDDQRRVHLSGADHL